MTAKRIYLPTLGPDDWQRLLADPAKQWKTGYSARTLAHCWEGAKGWPPEVANVLATSPDPALASIDLLLAIPEYKVDLPPRGRPSQNDLFVLGKVVDGGLVALTVEGKVGESFGPTVAAWNATGSPGKNARLRYITGELGLPENLPPDIRYQLLHRTTSALWLARQFNARHAIMLVHSFSPANAWFEDFAAFVAMFGVRDVSRGSMVVLGEIDGTLLQVGWASGDPIFLRA